MSSSEKTHCPTLSGAKDFAIWKVRIFGLLRREKVLGYATGRIIRPSTTTPAPFIYGTATSTSTWDDLDEKAHGIIVEHLSDRLAIQVSSLATSKEVLDKIIHLHESTNVGVRAFLALVEMIGARWDGVSSVEDHISRIREASSILDAMGRGVSDEFLGFLLLHSLPDEPIWDTFRTTILSAIPVIPAPVPVPAGTTAPPPVATVLLTFDTVEAKLVAQVDHMNRQVESAGDTALKASTSAHATSSRPSTSRPSSSTPGTQTCDLHGAGNHATKDCRTLKRRAEEKAKAKDKSKAKAKANSADADTDSDSSDASANAHFVTVGKRVAKSIRLYSARDSPGHANTCIADTGATSHIVPHRDWFESTSYRAFDKPRKVHFGDQSYAEALGIGDVHLTSKVDGQTCTVILTHVLHVPSFNLSLISVHRLCNKGIRAKFTHDACRVSLDGKVIMTGYHKRNLYHLRVLPIVHLPPLELAHAAIDINVLHRRLGHRNHDSLRRMVSKGYVENIEKVTGEAEFCEACAGAKARKIHLPPKTHASAKRPLQIVHSDVGGPVNVQSHRGYKYWITFIDEYTRHPWVYFLKKKSEAESTYDTWRKDIQAYIGAEIGEVQFTANWLEFFQTDFGGEYTSKAFEAKLRNHGVIHTTTAPDTPEQNGIAERLNQTLANSAVAMLIDSKLPKKYWDEAMLTAAYVAARSPTAGLRGETPYQSLFRRHVDTTFMRPFGCLAYALIDKGKRDGKLSRKGRKCIMIGYQPGKKAYRLLEMGTRKVFSCRHVVFNERGGDERPGSLLGDAEPTDEQWESMLKTLLRRHPEHADDDDENADAPAPSPGAVGGHPDSNDDDDFEAVGAPPRPPSPPSPRGPPGRGPGASPKPKVEPAAHPSRIPRASAPSTPAPARAPASSTPRTPSQAPTNAPAPARASASRTSAPAPARAPAPRTPRAQTGVPPAVPQAPARSAPANASAGETRRGSRARAPADRNATYNRAVQEERRRLDAQAERRRARANAAPASTQDASQDAQQADGPPDHAAAPGSAPADGAPAPPDAPEAGEGDEPFFAEFAGMASDTGPARAHPLPRSIPEALDGAESDSWRDAIAAELKSLQDNDVYEEVPIPHGVKPITSKPVFKVKLDQHGNVERFKMRLVARGFTQKKGVDYEETFAPVANLESVRIILALAARYDLEVDQMDVSTAYLNGELLEELYLSPPDGIDIKPGHCWRLKRSLYGLKQAGRTWNLTLDKALGELGFTRLDAETCLYVYRDGKGGICFLVVYVDDLLLAASSRQLMDKIKSTLSKRFHMHDLGEVKFILGIQVKRDRNRRTISLSQAQYIDSVLDRCGMTGCSPLNTPMSHSARMTADDPSDNTTIHEVIWNGCRVTYPSIIGSLMYAMLGTRPDIAYVVGVLGRYSANPKRCHWAAAKHVVRYLKGTRDLELRYDGSDVSLDLDFHGYTDADWSGDSDTSRSTSGYVFVSTRGAIGWSSKRQSMVALSTTESEYIGLSNAGQHLAWLRAFFEDIGHAQRGPTELFCDNQAAIILTRDPQFRARSKHISRKFHFVRDDIVGKGQAVVRYVRTDDQVADIFTKALGHDKHWKFARAMGLCFPDGRPALAVSTST
jgi:transposase InsO family protein